MVQGTEIVIILLVALVVLGPQRLPEVARKMGGWAAELRKAAGELRTGLEQEVSEFKKLGTDLKTESDALRTEMKGTTDVIGETSADLRGLGWVGPQPASGPTPQDALDDLARIEESAADEQAREADDGTGSAAEHGG